MEEKKTEIYVTIDENISKEESVKMSGNKEFFIQKAKELMESFSCCAEAKEAAQNWLDAVGTPKEEEAAKQLIAELEADIMPLDNLIAFASSEMGAKVFGAEKTKEVAAHGRELKETGAKYCDCPACAAAEQILSRKEELL